MAGTQDLKEIDMHYQHRTSTRTTTLIRTDERGWVVLEDTPGIRFTLPTRIFARNYRKLI